MLDLSRLEAGRLPIDFTEVQLPALMEEIQAEFQDVQEQRGLPVRWQIMPPLPSIYTDPGKLKVVVKNLLGTP